MDLVEKLLFQSTCLCEARSPLLGRLYHVQTKMRILTIGLNLAALVLIVATLRLHFKNKE